MQADAARLTVVVEEQVAQRDQVEALLTLGATRWEAARSSVRQAVHTGMIPIVNAMMVVGIVSLPGMMTGQILAGSPPVEAVKYQILIMFTVTAGTGFGVIAVLQILTRRMFDARERLRFDRLLSRSS